jgi:hypothetical protein
MQAAAQLPLPPELDIDPLIQAEPYEVQRLLHSSILCICHVSSGPAASLAIHNLSLHQTRRDRCLIASHLQAIVSLLAASPAELRSSFSQNR